jgi:hypothetical protein
VIVNDLNMYINIIFEEIFFREELYGEELFGDQLLGEELTSGRTDHGRIVFEKNCGERIVWRRIHQEELIICDKSATINTIS